MIYIIIVLIHVMYTGESRPDTLAWLGGKLDSFQMVNKPTAMKLHI